MLRIWIALFAISDISVKARLICNKLIVPLEVGLWRSNLKHLDSAVVENKPVSMSEGQVYVYENYFPGHVIQYVNVDNLAARSCGASASVKKGGVGDSMILLVLHAETGQEIRSVIDVWGAALPCNSPPPPPRAITLSPQDASDMKNLKSYYLDYRAVNHNQKSKLVY